MTLEELRAEVASILQLEQQRPTNWTEVEQRCLDVIRRLNIESEPPYPNDIVYHFLDDPDIRQTSPEYAAKQQQRLRRWLNIT